MTTLREPDLSRCPQCGGIADNGHDRSIPPNPYFCRKCMAQPVREPVATTQQTDLRTAARQALEALLNSRPLATEDDCIVKVREHNAAITALRAALAQPEPEPVAWECKAGGLRPLTQKHYDAQPDNIKRHYTRIAPPQQPEPVIDRTMATRIATQLGWVPPQPAPEPVAWLQPRSVDGRLRPDLGYETCSPGDYLAFPVYTAPPQRKENSND